MGGLPLSALGRHICQRCYGNSLTGVHVQGAMAIDNILKHGVNNFFILLDVFLSKQPFVSYHFQV